MQSLFTHLWNWYSTTGYLLQDLMVIYELFKYVETQPASWAPEVPTGYISSKYRNDNGMKIKLRNVSFKYPEQSQFVFKKCIIYVGSRRNIGIIEIE